ncbi:GNAT family N-acetyltransferase [Enterovibrio sp. ZSDZ42]|uniref:GNAT family N-acetyltransferase n=1 Tax=Enterovibrio gelatinilyticus TaxID=2899819 RepID=A0ABT5R796_9GAMM|nr:GNAT family N-acetyltransferase [Enterovibrio sp. ZSDZ42]MDD1796148.1 GNAT family N-acetyltransferase [Enterovibrio sp. ZSDZ42]
MDIKKITWQETIDIRHRVLWPENPASFCELNGDVDALHLGAFIEGQLVCVASVFIDGNRARLRKFATLPEYQGQGVGGAVLSTILNGNILSDQGVENFWCDARESAMSLYKRFGMLPEGQRFYKGDIPYFRMNIQLEQ